MALTNNLKLQVDLPVWEWCRFAPTSTSAVSSMTTANTLGAKYLYYQVSSLLYRYDTWTDSWSQLMSTTTFTTPTIMNNNVYSSYWGHCGRAISGGASTIEIAGLSGSTLVGYKIRIIEGTGKGQERTITAVAAPVAVDRGVVTTAGTSSITDASTGVGLKQWKINQWRDYQIRCDYGTGRTQVRPILYNTINSIVWADVNHITVNPWAQPYCATSWSATAGAQAMYVIESHQVTVDAAWGTVPDNTSRFVILGGGILNITQGTTSAPFMSASYYDVLADQWYAKSTQTGLKTVVFLAASDLSMERMTEAGGATVSGTATSGGNNTLTNSAATMIANQYINMTLTITGGTGIGQTRNVLSNTATVFTTTTNWTTNPDATSTYTVTGGQIISGIATSGAARSLTDSTLTLTPMQYANFEIRIVSGTGVGQVRTVLSNTATVFNVTKDWDTNPDATSVYAIYRDTGKVWLIGGGDSGMLQYSFESDQWTIGKQLDEGQCNQFAAKRTGEEPFALTSITRVTGGISVLSATPTAAGSGYNVDDILTITTGGTLGTARVLTVNATGGVLTVALETSGQTYTTGTTKATTVSPAGGTLCTLDITTIADMANVVTPIAHTFKIGDSVTISGATLANYNGAQTIIGVATTLAFSYVVTGTPTSPAVASASPSTTQVVDCTKAWVVNEHVGKLVQLATNAVLSTGQVRRIVSNTATTLVWTLAATAPVNGTSKYVIEDIKPFGTDRTLGGQAGGGTEGFATGGSTTTLIDSTKTWPINYWSRTVNRKVRIVEGTGVGNEIAITSNTATTLTYATQTFTPDTTTRYVIMDAFGTATSGTSTLVAGGTYTITLTDSAQNWDTNIWAGKRVRLLAGTGQGNEISITSNTATVLTFSFASSITPDTSTAYAILEATPKSFGIHLDMIIGSSSTALNNKYMYAWTGSATTELSRYNVTTEHWDLMSYFPQFETLTTGSMYVYDGADRIYFTKDATGRVMYYDLVKNIVVPASTIPYGHSTAISGNRMEIIQTTDGLKYLYVMRHSAQEMWRTLLYW